MSCSDNVYKRLGEFGMGGQMENEWMNENQSCSFSHLSYELALINSILGVEEVTPMEETSLTFYLVK